ncbi:MAG: hypothetical protein WCE68_03150 [Anaerolineales bacterium]
MIDIPVNAEVRCSDGPAGRSAYVIVNPINQLLTHLVVREEWPPFAEHMVPVERVEETSPNQIKLCCTREELSKMVPFVIEEYIHVKFPNYEKWREACLAWPYVLSENNSTFEESRYIPLELENTPNGEQAVRRGARVEASDGYLGQVEELLVNSKNMHVTHLVVREKHLWRNRDVAIPVSEIDHVDEDSVALKLDRKGIKELPAVPIKRWSL